jgi:hypothetical protein
LLVTTEYNDTEMYHLSTYSLNPKDLPTTFTSMNDSTNDIEPFTITSLLSISKELQRTIQDDPQLLCIWDKLGQVCALVYNVKLVRKLRIELYNIHDKLPRVVSYGKVWNE